MPFDALQFLEDHFGGAESVLNAVARHAPGEVLRRDAVDKWFSRKSIPSAWLPTLLLIVERETGQRPELRRYVGKANGHDIFD